MFKFSRLALRNIRRNKRRTAVTLMILVFGCAALILTYGFIATMIEGAKEAAIRQGIGHLQVYQGKYLSQEETIPLEHGLRDYSPLQRAVEQRPHVLAAEARLEFMGLISNGVKSVGFMGSAVQADRQQTMGILQEAQSGSNLLAASGPNPVILGRGLAGSLQAKPGDTLTLLATTAGGALNGIDVTVAGTFSTGFKEADDRLLSVRLETGQRLLDTDRVTKLVIMLDDTEQTVRVEQELNHLFQERQLDLATKNWTELAVIYKQVMASFYTVFAVLGLIIFVLVVLSSTNTMMMSIFERIPEIGTLMALGTSRSRLLRLFLWEGTLLGVTGGLLALALAYGLGTFINHANIRVPPPPGTTSSFALYFQLLPPVFIAVFILAVVMMALAAVLPAIRGARLKIVDALGHF